ncbi:MAG: hypothetical protein HFG71_03200 [Hungatella sp.]|jgi:ABC-2 type transport system permease protein|nr:hypothetical protein [Hungatella sp.]
MRDGIFLYGHYVSVQIKSMMQYKKSFMLAVMGQFLTSFNTFLGMFFMFQRFSAVGGFTYSQVVLCFGIFLMAFTLAECVARGFDTFSSIVRKGEFDRVMVRPRGLVLQVLGSRFELSRIGRMLQAVVMFIYGMRTSGICWDMPRVMTVVFMVAGGAVLFFGIFLAGAALCFFTLESLEIVNIFTYGAREFGTYPVGVYGKNILRFCTFVVPYGLVQYYPLLFLLGKREEVWRMFAPLLAAVFVVPCYGLWRVGVRRYQSAGS